MKVIGMLGGMSWQSTLPYYRIINETVQQRLGGCHSARLILQSVDFAEVESLMRAGDWEAAGSMLARLACTLEAAGAEVIVLCTNTLHKVAPTIEAALRIPLLHIVDPTAAAIRRAGFTTVGLLGTRFTMQQEFYRDRLSAAPGPRVLIPDAADCEIVDRIIFAELVKGMVLEESREQYRRIMGNLVADGSQAIVLGCTEIAMLVGPADAAVPLLDTTALHARAAGRWALE